jgi:F-type H+-transporting ATPase subunit delta
MSRLSAKQYAQGFLDSYTRAETGQRPTVIRKFFEILLRRRVIKLLPRILSHIQRLQDSGSGVRPVQVWSAGPTDAGALQAALASRFGPVRLETTIDPTLMGGLRLQIGDSLIDGTVHTRLSRLHSRLSVSA